ncbi:MAG: family 43 glycosylhydrolase [Pyrinomonadaceae bacterium]
MLVPRMARYLVIVFALFGALSISAQQKASDRNPSARHSFYVNPVLDEDFPDPTVMLASNGVYYVYATNRRTTNGWINIQVARSFDLIHWEQIGDALPVKPSWARTKQKFWAPDVSEHDGTFYMYYAVEPDVMPGGGEGMCLAVATSKNPQGPFVDSGKPLQCGAGFAYIDPQAFDDPQTGKHLLYYGSGFAPIRVRELSADRLSFAPHSQPIDLVRPVNDNSPQNYAKLVEGAWVIKRDGFYYLFYSGNNCCGEKAHYAVLVARSKSAFGPFETLAQASGTNEATGGSVILARSDVWIAPGHNSVIRDAAGQDWIVYHAINRRDFKPSGYSSRVMLIDRLVYRNGFPRVEGGVPTSTPQRAPVIKKENKS